jgi:choline dehydrogenase-like flavoprotein
MVKDFFDLTKMRPLTGSAEGLDLNENREAALRPWDEEVDVVVVGFGGAGASAAIESIAQGASVMVVERFKGGGATALSGGIVYLGGGTDLQRRAGYDDTRRRRPCRRRLHLQSGDGAPICT